MSLFNRYHVEKNPAIATSGSNNYLISGDEWRQLDVAFLEGPGSLETLTSAVPLTLKGEKVEGPRFDSHFVFHVIDLS